MNAVGTSEFLLIFGCCAGLLFPALFLFSLIMALTRKSRGWTVVAVISGILTLIVVIGAVAAGIFAGAKAAKEKSRPLAFPTSDGLATVIGAPGWSEQDIGSDDATLGIGNLFSGQFLVVLSEPKADFPEGSDLNDFADLAFEQFVSTLTDVSACPSSRVDRQSIPRVRREFNGQSDGTAIFYLVDYAEGRDHYYQLLSWSLAEQKTASKPVLEAALDSFRELGSP